MRLYRMYTYRCSRPKCRLMQYWYVYFGINSSILTVHNFVCDFNSHIWTWCIVYRSRCEHKQIVKSYSAENQIAVQRNIFPIWLLNKLLPCKLNPILKCFQFISIFLCTFYICIHYYNLQPFTIPLLDEGLFNTIPLVSILRKYHPSHSCKFF